MGKIALFLWLWAWVSLPDSTFAKILETQVRGSTPAQIAEMIYGDEASRDSVCIEEVKVNAVGARTSFVRYLAPFYTVAPGDTLEETTYLLTGTVNGVKYLEGLNEVTFTPDLTGHSKIFVATLPQRKDFESRLKVVQDRRAKKKIAPSLSAYDRFVTRYENITCQKKQEKELAEAKTPEEKWKKQFSTEGDGLAFGLNRVDQFVKSNSYKKAESQLRLLKKAYPTSEQPNLALADFYENRQKIPEAESAYQDALKINARNPATYLSLLRIYKAQKKTDEAQAAARELIQVLPATQNFPTVKEALGASSD